MGGRALVGGRLLGGLSRLGGPKFGERRLTVWGRLGRHAVLRRHIVDGRATMVLRDLRNGELLVMSDDEWRVLSVSAGHTSEQIQALLGGAYPQSSIDAFREQLEARDLFSTPGQASGRPDGPSRDGAPRSLVPSRTTIDVLPDFRLRCHGGGTCCRLFDTILFRPEERARALRVLPMAKHPPGLGFAPIRGGPGPGAALATPSLREGACVYLRDTRRCGLEERGGSDAKPLGCRLYPAHFVDDGEALRVSVSVECTCVLSSLDADGGDPLVPPALLEDGPDPGIAVEALAPDAMLRALRRDALAFDGDPVAHLLAVGDALSGEASLDGALSQLAVDLSAAACDLDRFRAPGDLARRSVRQVAEAASVIVDEGLRPMLIERGPVRPSREEFYLRAGAHAYRLFAGGRAGVFRRIARLLVARLLALFGNGDVDADPIFSEPLALVEAVDRAYGLTRGRSWT
ncbi:MAG: hypothetical protein AAGF12_18935 [Myxococcota bacterium]